MNNNRSWTPGPDAHELYVEWMADKAATQHMGRCATCGKKLRVVFTLEENPPPRYCKSCAHVTPSPEL